MIEQEQLDVDKLRAEVDRKREEERKQQFLDTPFRRKENPVSKSIQLDMFSENS